MNKRRLPIVVVLLLVVVVALAVVGLPVAQFGFTSVQAQYSGCGTTYQLRLNGDSAQTYSDAGLTQPAIAISGAVNGTRQKYLICDPIASPLTSKSVLAIVIAQQIVYVSASAGQIVPQYYTDAQ